MTGAALDFAELGGSSGRALGTSRRFDMTQQGVDAFAASTADEQPVPVGSRRRASGTLVARSGNAAGQG
jgi:hypothetical protein